MENISANSQFRLHHSQWLQSTLAEVDDKFEAILNLVDDDGETFAKRAEMYYEKKPQLIELLQDLQKSYRVLAENHDQLKYAAAAGTPTPLSQPDDEPKSAAVAVESEAFHTHSEVFLDCMKRSVRLLKDNESTLVSFSRKYKEQREEISKLKSEIMLLKWCNLDDDTDGHKEKRTSISKFKRAVGRLLSVRKN